MRGVLSLTPSISADGIKVAFDTYASNLVPGDTNGAADVFIRTLPSMRHGPFFGSSRFGTNASAGGWVNNDTYPRELGDVNGDGRADVVGFGFAGVQVALGQPDGTFDTPKFALDTFGNDAGGWSNDDAYPRQVADVNGDGRADIVGFGQGRVYTAQGTTDGTFALDKAVLSDFTVNAGYTTNDQFPRQVADVNGDGRADIVAFGYAGTYTALGTPDGGFGATQFALSDFGFNAGGWSSDNLYPREVADVNGDGRADIVGFKDDGVYVALGNANGTFF